MHAHFYAIGAVLWIVKCVKIITEHEVICFSVYGLEKVRAKLFFMP